MEACDGGAYGGIGDGEQRSNDAKVFAAAAQLTSEPWRGLSLAKASPSLTASNVGLSSLALVASMTARLDADEVRSSCVPGTAASHVTGEGAGPRDAPAGE